MTPARGWSVEGGHGAPLAQDRVAFDSLAEGFALVSLAPAPMAMLAGRLPELGAQLRVDQRSEKLRASAQLQQQGNTPVAAGRLEGGSGLVGHAGGQVGLDGGGETALFAGVGLRQARLGVEGQALLLNEGEVSAICLEAAGRLHLGSPVKGVDDLVLVGPGKFGVLYAGQTDPRLKTLATYESKLEDTSFMDVTAGDLNGDGLLDVAVLDTRSQYIDIATWVPGKGLVHALYFKLFEAKTFNSDEKTGSDPREAAIADVTGDGRQDLILLTHDRVVVYPQDTGE
jgi:hypothetical protein